MNNETTKEGKSMTFVVEKQDSSSKPKELDDETLALITKNFSKILKQINRWLKPREENFRTSFLLMELSAPQGRITEQMPAIPDLQYSRILHINIIHHNDQKISLRQKAFSVGNVKGMDNSS